MNVTRRNPEKYILAMATAILSRLSLEKHDKHDGAQVIGSVLSYLTLTRLPLSKRGRTGLREHCASIYTALHSHSERMEHFYSILIRAINASKSHPLSRMINMCISHSNLPILRLIRMERRTSEKNRNTDNRKVIHLADTRREPEEWIHLAQNGVQ